VKRVNVDFVISRIMLALRWVDGPQVLQWKEFHFSKHNHRCSEPDKARSEFKAPPILEQALSTSASSWQRVMMLRLVAVALGELGLG
jgi:hypothetical protein